MRVDQTRSGSAVTPGREPALERPLARDLWDQAIEAYHAGTWIRSLALVDDALARARADTSARLSIVPAIDAPCVHDAYVLRARNLYQLERREEFDRFLETVADAAPGRDLPAELDAVRLAFACKEGRFASVVSGASEFIDTNRDRLPAVIAEYLFLRGMAHSHLGNPDPAREDAEAAHALQRLLGRDRERGRTANLLGILHLRASRFAEAESWFRRALEVHTRLAASKNAGGNRLNIAITMYKRGMFDAAMAELRGARRLLRDAKARVSLCRADLAMGQVQLLRGDPDAATGTLLAAFEMSGKLRLAREEALALEFLGDASAAQDQLDKARRYYSRSLAVGRTVAPEGDVVMEVLRRQGQCLAAQGRQSEAVPLLGRALNLARRLTDRFEEGVTRRILAEVLLDLGDLESARTASDQAAAVLEDIGARFELAHARRVQARTGMARLDAGRGEDATVLLDEAWRNALSSLDLFLQSEVDAPVRVARGLLMDISRRRSGEDGTGIADGRPRHQHAAAPPIIHTTPIMRDVIQLCDAFADSDEPVLITGPTGTGKELFAQRLHAHSRRHGGKLVSVNVSAIPEGIFAREFFGHVRGAYSGAEGGGEGLAAAADGGTLFLDEIGDLPLALQPQLLRLLQDGTYQALGDPRERRVDLRLVAATNADLAELVAAGRFRADLYYRLKILELRLPPLTDRRGDIEPLLRHFLGDAAGRPVETREFFNSESLEQMEGYSWPGNVREVAMVARQAHVQLVSRGEVRVELGEPGAEAALLCGPRTGVAVGPRPLARGGEGRSSILLALAEAAGNRAEAARRLGVSRSTLYRRLEKLGIGGKTDVG